MNIENQQSEILCALISPEMSMPNLWEFPGGKVEEGEDIFEALEREMEEELGCRIQTSKEIYHDNLHEYDTFIILLISIKCQVVKGDPIPSEHSNLIWLKRENLASLKWAPADIPSVEKLMTENNYTSKKIQIH